MKKLFLFLICWVYFLVNITAQKSDQAVAAGQNNASQNDKVAMADLLRADGKIYVVVAVISVIMLGLFVYLFSLDRKIVKIENWLKNNFPGKA